jgi:hypothetical protein
MNTVKVILMGFLVFIFSGCDSQTSKKGEQIQADKESHFKSDSLHKPKINVNVNKRYDKNGHVVQFDSTYSYSYSSPNGPLELRNDSVINNFRTFLDNKYPDLWNLNNNAIFFNDSLFKYDFFNKDYFQKRFELNQQAFQKLYQQMDSIKQSFLQRNYPQGFQKKRTF